MRNDCRCAVALLWVFGLLGFVVIYLVVSFRKQYGAWAVLAVLVPTAMLIPLPWLLAYGLPYLRGRRNRERGVPCLECHKAAFPVEGTTNHYRCWNCGCRFEGPEHF
jgi:hypothetical protein